MDPLVEGVERLSLRRKEGERSEMRCLMTVLRISLASLNIPPSLDRLDVLVLAGMQFPGYLL